MFQFTNEYQGQLRTEAIHLKSGTHINTDAPTDNHGRGEAFSPTDLTCISLASCKMTTMGILAQREGIDLAGLRCEVEKIMAASPRRIAEIVVDMYLPNPDLTDKQRQMLKNAALTCPVALSLSPEVKRTVNFHF
jgi:putative redox protein